MTRALERPVAATVSAEFRGEVCVVRCLGADGVELADDLCRELERCRSRGVWDVVVDVDRCVHLGVDEIAVLADAAHSFHEGGGELVVAAEEAEVRAALAEAGLVHTAIPASPARRLAEKGSPVSLPLHPRWEHEFHFPALADELPKARRRLSAYAEVAGLDEPALFEFSVAAAEALTNAVVHGSPHGADDDVRVRFFSFDDEVAVEVSDGGGGIDASPICAPAVSQSTGRGIHFMRALCDAVQFVCGPLGTHVLLVKRRG
jgi:anti-sigma regulatory factor (Ser/Thr protein kinase)